MNKDKTYRSYFTEPDPHAKEKLQQMETARLFTELDDVVNILCDGEIDGLPGKAYRSILSELKERL